MMHGQKNIKLWNKRTSIIQEFLKEMLLYQ